MADLRALFARRLARGVGARPLRFLNDVPIRRKLTLITMATTAIALGLACAAIEIYDQAVLRHNLVAGLTATAQMVGFNTATALSLNDPRSAGQTLQCLTAQPRIAAACLYGPDGAPFATYFRADEPPFSFPARAPAEQTTFRRDHLDLVRALQFAGHAGGTIFLRNDVSDLHASLLRSAFAFVSVMLGAGFIAYLIVAQLQRVISEPVSGLAAIAARVAADNNYSVRAHKHGNDEVGGLIDGFNAMLAQVESRDAALQQAQAQLEQRVEERTRDLVLEIAERRRTEEERDGFFLLSTDLMVIAGNDGRVRRANPAFAVVLGYSPAEMQGVRFMDLIHADDRARTVWRVKRITAGQAVSGFETRSRHRDGSYRWISWNVNPAPGKTYFYAGGRDVTALRDAQERAARQQERLQLIFDSAPVGLSLRLAQSDGSVTRLINDAHLRICGLTREEAGQADAFLRITHPDDAPQQRALRDQLEQGLIGRFALEKRYLRPDGQTVWVAFTLERRRTAGGHTHDLSTIVDITALKRAQEEVAQERARFKFIFDSVPVGIALILPGNREARLVNPAHARITGIPGAQVSDPKVFERATHPDDVERQRVLVAAFKRGEIDRFTLEKRYVHADGRVVWVVLSRRMFVDATSGLQQAITTVVDITERKEAEARLAETHRQLLATSRAAGMAEVATGVLHNVGNVLNSVNVSATLLTDMVRESEVGKLGRLAALLAAQEPDLARFFATDPRAAKVPVFVRTLAEQLQRERAHFGAELAALRKNIEHIKDVVAMQQSYAKVSGVCEHVAIAELADDALRLNAAALARHEINVVRDYRANPTLLVEKHKVLQILVNLIQNAKYACAEMGAADRRVTLRITEAAGRVRLAVVDNGVGIPAENLTRIFSHGFTTRKQGHGFGLHSGALAARELGGSLVAQSDGPGRGASFTLELPLVPRLEGGTEFPA